MAKLKIALLQAHLHWENPVANRKQFSEKIATIASDIDVVVLPEMFSTGFTMNPEHIAEGEDNSTLDWLQKQAATTNIAIVGSTVFSEAGTHYNRLFFIEPNGNNHYYNKRHTFTLAGEDKVYRSGESRLLVDYKGFTFCPLICYDLRFPVWSRNTQAYDVLLYVANWPKPRITAWDTLLKARAIENMAYCVGVNRVGLDGLGHEYPGHSAVYDPLGECIVYSEKEDVLIAEIDKEQMLATREKLQFLEDRDSFTIN